MLETAQNPNEEPHPAYPSDKSWNEASAIYMTQGTLPELTVQQIISCNKTDGGCQGGDLPTAFDSVRNTAGGIDSDSDFPQTIVTSWDTQYGLALVVPATIKTKEPSQQL